MMKNSKNLAAVFAAIIIFSLGYYMRGPSVQPQPGNASAGPSVAKPAELTCSMHPQIRQPKPGKCPLCAMDLIPVGNESEGMCPAELKLSESAEKLACIQTAPVERKFVTSEIRMLGKIAYNEETTAYLNARFSGRIDKLFVKSIGVTVKKGEPLAEVYSPDLRVLQQELIQSYNLKESKPNDPGAANFFESIKDKYKLSGFSDEEITQIISKGRGADRTTSASQVAGVLLTLVSPINGNVIEKKAVAGKYFEKGENLFTIVDMSRVWINVEAYETDLPWLKYGQEVEFTTDACPGRKFNARIALIQPVLDETTRTVGVRLAADNQEGRLKPGMFVHATVRAKIAEGGKVIDSSLAGKWISPMHPEIIKDAPGNCDICGTPLVTAESLGLAGKPGEDVVPPLVIPATAALLTGRRAVVYVSVQGKKNIYEGREVVLGPRAGDYFIVESGLKEGELVVTNGSFKIDSSLQIFAKPSMMAPARNQEMGTDSACDAASPKDNPPPPDDVMDAYFKVQMALFTENMQQVMEQAAKLDAKYPSGLSSSKDVWEARKAFEQISKLLYRDLVCSESNLKKPLFKMFCPMAFEGRGAFWIQDAEKVQNPYFGPTMPDCGELKQTIGAGAKPGKQ